EFDSGGGTPYSAVVGDFAGNGHLDLAVANNTGFTLGGLLGNGNGTFKPPVTYIVKRYPENVAVGDFNGDGIPDLVVTNYDVDQTFTTVSVLLGWGDGSFRGPVSFATGTNPVGVAVGDLNGDGFPDRAVTNFNYLGTVTVLTNAANW